MVGLRALYVAVALGCASVAGAQQPANLPRVGFISAASASGTSDRALAFRQGLRQLGYVEGRNLRVEYRWTDGDLNLLPKVVAEMVKLKVDVIVSAGPAVTRSIKRASVKIPVIMAFDHDPVGSGFVASLARPGGNITGFSTLTPQISGKQLEILKDVVSKLSRVAIVSDSTMPGNAQAAQEIERTAATHGMQLQHLEMRASKDFAAVFKAAVDGRAEAVVLLTSPLATAHRAQFIELANKTKLPTMYYVSEFVEEGGLMTYSASIPDLFRRSAGYVDKILKGEKPANLPVEQPTKFDFVINLKAANEIGLKIPAAILARADKVIR
jgi:putative tryptophan/tyrosine transport system substrate-binding protein